MINFIFYIWNPTARRDKHGKVISDMKRRKASKRTEKLLEKKEIARGRAYQGRKFRVSVKGNVDMRGDAK